MFLIDKNLVLRLASHAMISQIDPDPFTCVFSFRAETIKLIATAATDYAQLHLHVGLSYLSK